MLDLVNRQPLPGPASPAPDVQRLLQLGLIDRDGRIETIKPDRLETRGFRAGATWRPLMVAAGVVRGWEVELSLVSTEARDGLGIQVVLPARITRVMIPGLIYGENRLAAASLRYPRVAAGAGDSLTSAEWAFRLDRASHGVVLAWTDAACLALAAEEMSPLGISGLAFRSGDDGYLALNFPAREEPVSYVGVDAAAPAEVITHDWQAGEIASLRFLVLVAPPDPHAYDAVLRTLYQRDAVNHDLNPWMPVEEAAVLTAHGLHRWHYRPDTKTLAETTAFHREADETRAVTGDREAMHVAWLSGAPVAHALLAFGHEQSVARYADAAVLVLDTIAAGLAPCGTFWGRWTPDGWDGGWNGHRDRIHSRTIAEATLFMLRAREREAALEIDHPAWTEALRSNLRFAVDAQRPDGAFPSIINGRTGTAESWRGAAGLLWVAALVEGSNANLSDLIGGEPYGADFIAAALRAGSYYARFIEDEFIFGAPEDTDLAPTSEDGYNAVIAYTALYEATRDARWLQLAKQAAEWMLSFRWSYNLSFPAHTILNSYDYRSRGADQASPRNQHLHTYGLICLPELARLSEHTGDPYFRQRAIDSLSCALQFVAREDGDFNARKGMVSERYYNTRCFGPKGAILPVSHAWSAGLVLYACQAGLTVDAPAPSASSASLFS